MRQRDTRRFEIARRAAAVHGALAAAAWMGCAPAPPPRVAEASAAEVEAAVKRFEEAWEREDLETAAGAFTPDAVVFDPVPPGKFERAEGIRAWISGSFDSLERIAISTSELRVRTAGPVAWATGRYVFEARQVGGQERWEGYMSTVWLRQTDGSLKLSVFHASHFPSAPGG
jgi:ketosteroid isomerase-like protein